MRVCGGVCLSIFMSASVVVCVPVSVSLCACLCAHLLVCATCASVCMCMCIRVSVQVSVSVHLRFIVCLCMCARALMSLSVCIQVSISAFVCTCMCVCMYLFLICGNAHCIYYSSPSVYGSSHPPPPTAPQFWVQCQPPDGSEDVAHHEQCLALHMQPSIMKISPGTIFISMCCFVKH